MTRRYDAPILGGISFWIPKWWCGRQVVKEGWAARLRVLKSLSKKKAHSAD